MNGSDLGLLRSKTDDVVMEEITSSDVYYSIYCCKRLFAEGGIRTHHH